MTHFQDGVGEPDALDRLWTPHRMAYIRGENKPSDESEGECPFCRIPSLDDAEGLVVHRGDLAFVVLNLYPYSSGHLMIVPFEHTADFSGLSKPTADEMFDLARRAHAVLEEVYRPHGFNLGINLGQSAGAGVADHLHMHVLPRWTGDANFMTTVAETRVLPEDLKTTYEKLKGRF